MPFLIIRNDISQVTADCIVNSANPLPEIGYGVDSAIYEKAGKELLLARRQIGTISAGESRITSGYNLKTSYIIHTVVPIWIDGKHKEIETLRACFSGAFELALKHDCHSIAFPLLGTGNNGFPKHLALQYAIDVIRDFLNEHDLTVYLVVYDKDSYAIASDYRNDIQTFIDDHYISRKKRTFSKTKFSESRSRNLASHFYEDLEEMSIPDSSISVCDSSIDSYLKPSQQPEGFNHLFDDLEDSFSERLIKLIDASGLSDPQVYKRANIDRKLFSKIKNDRDYKPRKATVLAFAIALRLSLVETRKLLESAGYALSHSSKFDIILEYFISNHNYDVFEINEVLFLFDQPLIGE